MLEIEKLRRKDLLLILYFLLSFLFLALANQLINLNYVIITLYLCFVLWIVRVKKWIFLKYFYFIFLSTWNVVSVFAIDTFEIYLPNLKITSYHSGALAPLAIVEYISLALIIILEGKKKRPKVKENRMGTVSSYKYISFLFLGIALAFVIEIANKNYYISGSSDRFYYAMAVSAVSFSLYGYLLFVYPYLTINAEINGKRKLLWAFTIVYSLYVILVGQKFGPFLKILFVLLLTYFIPFRQEFLKKNYRKVLKLMTVLAIIFIIFSLFQMSIEKGSVEVGTEQLINRVFNGQGDIWWGIYTKYSGQTLHYKEIGDELGAFFSSDLLQQDYNFGIYKMMNLIAPHSIILYYAQRGARFTNSSDASMFYYFGISGLIVFKICITIIMYWLVNKIIDSCRNKYGLDSMLYVWLFTHFSRIVYMSEFNLFICSSAIMCYVLLIFNKTIGHKVRWSNKV